MTKLEQMNIALCNCVKYIEGKNIIVYKCNAKTSS